MRGVIGAHARGSCSKMIPDRGGVRCDVVGFCRIGDTTVAVFRHTRSGGYVECVESLIGERSSCSGVIDNAPGMYCGLSGVVSDVVIDVGASTDCTGDVGVGVSVGVEPVLSSLLLLNTAAAACSHVGIGGIFNVGRFLGVGVGIVNEDVVVGRDVKVGGVIGDPSQLLLLLPLSTTPASSPHGIGGIVVVGVVGVVIGVVGAEVGGRDVVGVAIVFTIACNVAFVSEETLVVLDL